jgi:four helix bundle protein
LRFCRFGAVAQLGERLNRTQEVGSSNLLSSIWFTVDSSRLTERSLTEKFNFEKLNVYKEAVAFSKEVYRITEGFPKEEAFGLTSQMRRAATSIALNIAEGSSLTKAEFRNFLRRARGSNYECVPIVEIALANEYIDPREYQYIYEQCNKLAKLLNGLIKSI